MTNLKIRTLVGERCVTSEDGQRVYDEIHDKLLSGEKLCLDFEKVTVFASPFFNFAIGQLFKDLRAEILNRLLTVKDLSPDGMLVWRRVVKNAKEYYGNANKKQAIDEILREQSEEE